MKTPVCLTMIVKDEAEVIVRGMESALPYITHYAICDTGSKDNTKTLIREFMAKHNIPGQVFDTPWKNFGHNRSISLEKSREICPDGWSWVLDADDSLEGTLPDDFLETLHKSDKNCSRIDIHQNGAVYHRIQLFRNSFPWKYERALHEYPTLDKKEDQKVAVLPPSIWNVSRREGARNKDPKKYQKDAEILMGDLAKYPNDPRTLFYLGQSWRDAGNKEKAMKYYRRRAELEKSWEQERYVAYLEIIKLATNWKEKIELAWKAIELDARRLEVPFLIGAEALATKQCSQQVYAMLAMCGNREATEDMLFAEFAKYKWLYDDMMSCAAWNTKHPNVAIYCVRRALENAPEEHKERLAKALATMEESVKRVNEQLEATQ